MTVTLSLRKVALTAHVASSVGWLGAVAGFLALAVAGLISHDAQTVQAAYLAMELNTWFVIIPLAFVALLSGLVSSLGTKWGLFRYYWVPFKFLITILAILVLLVHTQPIDLLADAAAKTKAIGAHFQCSQLLMVQASGAGLLVLLVTTAQSVYKPPGMTRYGARKQRREPRAM